MDIKKVKSIKNVSGLKEKLPENLKCFFLDYSDEDLVTMTRNRTISHVRSIGPIREKILLDYLDDYLYDRNNDGYPIINFASRLIGANIFSNAEYEFRRGWIGFERKLIEKHAIEILTDEERLVLDLLLDGWNILRVAKITKRDLRTTTLIRENLFEKLKSSKLTIDLKCTFRINGRFASPDTFMESIIKFSPLYLDCEKLSGRQKEDWLIAERLFPNEFARRLAEYCPAGIFSAINKKVLEN